MRKRWIVLSFLLLAAGTAGYGLTREDAQKVQKINAYKIEAEYVSLENEGLNPLEDEQYPEVSDAVSAYFAKAQKKADFIERYDEIHVYTKLGYEEGSYVAFVTYQMKIRDIYTEVPGLGTFFVRQKRQEDGYEVWASVEDPKEQAYIRTITKHSDVQKLFADVNGQYIQAVQSDAILKEVLEDLQNAL